ncbi:MAG: AAA family ATPase [Oscillospiraceae bacterium]|jgi:ATP-dependent Clp protease ATP-binding subunit ClpA|nr:AAA family ATPase [Oscillospiraceae bacterium]
MMGVGGTIIFFTFCSAILPVVMNAMPKGVRYLQEKSSASYYRINTKNSIDELEIALRTIKGQKNAKTQIMNTVAGWLEAKENPDNKPGGLIIHLAGISGTGKSIAAEALTKVLLGENSKSIKLSYRSIDSNSQKTVAEQLFGQTTENFGQIKVDKNTPLTAQLKFNPNTIIEIHEFDKFMEKDDTLQAKLWDIADNGQIDVNGQTLDCKDTIFILTSNSSKESVGMGTDTEDATASLERVNYRQAFLNRINTVYFEDFSLAEYNEIFEQKLQVVVDYYNKKFKLLLNVSAETKNKIAQELKSKKIGGARNIRPIIDKIYVALAKFKKDNGITESSKHKQLEINLGYNENDKNFVVN